MPVRKTSPFATLILLCLLLPLCVACNTGSTDNTANSATQARQLLQHSEQELTTAHTLHAGLTIQIDGETYSGSLTGEIWREGTSKSRSLVERSTIAQFPAGEIIVSNGTQLWIYDAAQHTVYEGQADGNGSSAFGSSSSPANQLTLNLIDAIFQSSNASLVSAPATVNGHQALVIQVTSGQPAANGPDYAGQIYLDRQSDLPLQLSLNLDGFAQVTLTLTDLELNRALPESLFSFTPPPGTRVNALSQASPTPATGTLTLAQAEQVAGYHLLSIPSTESNYQLEGVDVLTTANGAIFVLHYLMGGASFSIIEGRPLAQEPLPAGSTLTVRGTTATYATADDNPTLSWKEQGLGIRISGDLDEQQAVAIATVLV
jgi:outer membrane lipoprotein-sorting protein